MLSNQFFNLIGNININAGCSIGLFNLLCLLKLKIFTKPCGYHFLNHFPLPAAAARGATTIQRLIVISIAMA